MQRSTGWKQTESAMKRRRVEKPCRSDPGQILELVARMKGRGNFRIPVEGRGTSPSLEDCDVAGALGMMRCRLASALCEVVVCRGGRTEIGYVVALADSRLQRAITSLRKPPLDVRCPADHWRLRMVAFDAVHALIWPERCVTLRERAWNAKMRLGDYTCAYRVISAVLHELRDDGAREFSTRMRNC